MIAFRRYLFILSLLVTSLQLAAQQLTGTIIDAETGEALPYASVVYKDHNLAVISNIDGKFSIARKQGWKLSISYMGYQTLEFTVNDLTKNTLSIALRPDRKQLAEVTVKAKKGRYSRKNNPAVELMRKVIAEYEGPDSK